VYAVRSTGIYCRPSCPSRLPHPARVVFFPTAEEAGRAGFRPCRRCKPDAAAPPDPWIEKIRRACRYLSHVDGAPTLSALAARVGGSHYHVQRNFKRLVGVTPREYVEACRLGKVKRQLRAGSTVTGAIVDAGYGSSSRFYEGVASRLGMLPQVYRRGAPGLRIRYATIASPLGCLLVAATPRGVCSVAIGGSADALARELGREFPGARIVPDRRALAGHLRRILAHVAGRRPRIDLPLDVQATAFQWLVWQALAAIPRGSTRSYGEIARAIGRPTAARAVARACASNPTALLIPCHRAVGVSGAIGGYRWGVSRKKALLARERSGPS
jgi:AraC family transcriptional regulator of adaptative response/methylated-DNA-[protein]-cysteine methyltransferase